MSESDFTRQQLSSDPEQPLFPTPPTTVDAGSLPTQPVQPTPPAPPPVVTQTVPTELAHTAGDDTYPLVASIPTASRKRRSRATITLLVLVLVLFGGAGALGTLYFRAQSRLDLTTHEVSTTKNTLTDVQGQLTQANADNRTLTTQKTNLNTQIGLMTPCARSAKALADILDTDLKTNVNPFLDNKIVGPMSEEIGYCR